MLLLQETRDDGKATGTEKQNNQSEMVAIKSLEQAGTSKTQSQDLIWDSRYSAKQLEESQVTDEHIQLIWAAKQQRTRPTSQEMTTKSQATRHYWIFGTMSY